VTTWLNALTIPLLIAGLSGCGLLNGRDESGSHCQGISARNGDVSVCVTVPAGEPASIGSMLMTVREGKAQQLLQLERDGTPESIWLLPGAGHQPVMVVMTRSAGSGSYPVLQRLEPVYGGYAESDMASLSREQLEGYMGHDRFEVFDGQLYRYFPRYRTGDTNMNPTGGEACYRYDFTSEHWFQCPPDPRIEAGSSAQ